MAARLRHKPMWLSNLRQETDKMDGYIIGTTESHGGPGMVRAADYGNYKMVKHKYGYSNGKGPPPLRTRYDSGEMNGPGPFPAFMKMLDGVNSTRSVLLKKTFTRGYTKYTFEVRPAVATSVVLKANGFTMFENKLEFGQHRSCNYLKMSGVSLNLRDEGKPTDPFELQKAYEKCEAINEDGGDQCNGISDSGLQPVPAPYEKLNKVKS